MAINISRKFEQEQQKAGKCISANLKKGGVFDNLLGLFSTGK